MNNEVRATLMQAFALGYCDEMAGRPVGGDDEIDSETASEIEAAALVCIAKPESTEGRPWGQSLKKPSGAPLNLG